MQKNFLLTASLTLAMGSSLMVACSSEEGSGEAGSGEDAIQAAQQAMWDGTIDHGNKYRMVGEMRTGGIFQCSASLVNGGVAITASHCLQDYIGWVEKSTEDKRDRNRIEQVTGMELRIHDANKSFRAIRVVNAKLYGRNKIYRRSHNDFAVFSLASCAKLDKYAVVADWTSDAPQSFTGTMVGYGGNSTRRFASEHATVGKWWTSVYKNPEFKLVDGDSGGPLLNGDGFEIVGVLNAVDRHPYYPEGERYDYPNVASIATYRNWVLEAIEQLSEHADTDGDGVTDSCDSCPLDPTVSSWDEVDSDRDGIPNACDPFPCSPQYPGEEADDDKDGLPAQCDPTAVDAKNRDPNFCKEWCAKHPIVDNCPWDFNPGQENCNADAERAVRAKVMGDACDPVPCADGEPDEWTYHLVATEPKVAPGPNKPGWEVRTIRAKLNRFKVEKRVGALRVPPYHADPSLNWTQPAYRYCQPNPPFVVCSDDSVIKDEYLDEPESKEHERSIWHIVHAGHNVSPPAGPMAPGIPWETSDVARYYGCTEDGTKTCVNPYPTVFDVHWNYKHDFAKWEARWEDGPKFSVGTVAASEDGGRFWFHVGTEVGFTKLKEHPMLNPNEAPHDLANHYTYVTPEYEYTVTETFPALLTTIPRDQLLNFEQPCLVCGRGDLRIQLPPWASNPRETLLMASVDTPAGRYTGFVSDTGEIWANENMVADSVAMALSDRTVNWLNPSEANPDMGRSADNPAMVAISADGTAVERVIDVSAGELRVMERDTQAALQNAGTTSTQQTASMQVPAPRQGFASVYSRSMGLVFVVGGQQPAQAVDEAPIVAINVATGHRMQLRSDGYSPRNVVAATHSAQDEALWIIEEVPKNSQQMSVQIVRVGVPDGSVEVYGPWPRFKHNNRLWLAADAEGGIVLVASSDKQSQYSVQGVRRQNGKLRSDWVQRGNNATVGGGPIVDLSGVRLRMSNGAIERVKGPKGHSAGNNGNGNGNGNGNNGNGNGNCGNSGNGNGTNNGNGNNCVVADPIEEALR